MKRCTFTGHRPLYFPWQEDESAEGCIRLKAALKTEIRKAIRDGFTYFIAGGAEGVDTWAAEMVLAEKRENPQLQLEIAKPFAAHNKHLKGACGERLASIDGQADKITVISDGKDEAADYILRDYYMVDASDRVIVVYDDDSVGKSGTRDTLLYAVASGKEIKQIQWQHLT